MLRLPPFELRRPRTVEEAAAILAGEGPAARLVAGGTDLWPNMKRRHQKAATVISLLAIDELRGIGDGDGAGVAIGATTTLAAAAADPRVRERYPALAKAFDAVSSPPLREMGTVGGNLCVDTRCTYYNQPEEWRRAISYCMKEEGEICWVATSSPKCWAHSASDSAPMLCALGAEVELASTEGHRRIPVRDLYRNDGIDYLTKGPEDIVTAVRLPEDATAARCRTAFWKLRRRGSIDFAVLSAAAAVWTDGDGVVERAELWLGAVASSPVPAPQAARLLVGRRLDPEACLEAARLAAKPATPMDNTDFQAQWRKAVLHRYVEAVLRECAGLPVERFAGEPG